MTKFEEEVKRPANGPLTELNNNMQEVFSQYRKMRQYADYLEYDSKQKDEYILKLENENSFMRDERTTFDSNGMAVEPKLQQQSLPVVPECVAGAIESIPNHYSAFEALDLIKSKVETLPEENKDWLPVFNWLCEGIENQDIFALAFITGKYEVEKPQLFKLIFPKSTSVLQKDGELNSFADTVYKRYLIENAMNEQEIKSIDERYWQFAVPVEDGE